MPVETTSASSSHSSHPVPGVIMTIRAIEVHLGLGLGFVVLLVVESMALAAGRNSTWSVSRRWDVVRHFATPLIGEASWFVPVALALIGTAYAWNYAIGLGERLSRHEYDERNAAVTLARSVATLVVSYAVLSAIGIQRPVDQVAPVMLIAVCAVICSLLAGRLERFYRADPQRLALAAAERVAEDQANLRRLNAPVWGWRRNLLVAVAQAVAWWMVLAGVMLLDEMVRQRDPGDWIHQTNEATPLLIVPVMALALSWSYLSWRPTYRPLQFAITALVGTFPVAFVAVGIDIIRDPAYRDVRPGVAVCLVAVAAIVSAAPLWRSGRRRSIAPVALSLLGDAVAAAIFRWQLARHEEDAVRTQEILDASLALDDEPGLVS